MVILVAGVNIIRWATYNIAAWNGCVIVCAFSHYNEWPSYNFLANLINASQNDNLIYTIFIERS